MYEQTVNVASTGFPQQRWGACPRGRSTLPIAGDRRDLCGGLAALSVHASSRNGPGRGDFVLRVECLGERSVVSELHRNRDRQVHVPFRDGYPQLLDQKSADHAIPCRLSDRAATLVAILRVISAARVASFLPESERNRP